MPTPPQSVLRNRPNVKTLPSLLPVAVAVVVASSFPLTAFAATTGRRSHSTRHHSRSSALSSRGGYDRATDPTGRVSATTGRVGVITSSHAVFHREYNESSAVLSRVSRGTNIAILYEAGDYYGVLMADSTVGWVTKSSVQLIDYQVQVSPQSGAAATAVAEAGPGETSGAVSDSGEGALPPLPSSGTSATAQQVAAGTLSSNGLSSRTYALLQQAFTYLGVPYVWGGGTRRGLDCSAFVQSVFASQGISLPRVAADQARVGAPVEWRDLQPGDRLYFDMGNKGRISHTGIYLGNGYFIHASTNHMRVDVDSVFRSNYYRALVCARRSA